jgi:hypothetical protein
VSKRFRSASEPVGSSVAGAASIGRLEEGSLKFITDVGWETRSAFQSLESEGHPPRLAQPGRLSNVQAGKWIVWEIQLRDA